MKLQATVKRLFCHDYVAGLNQKWSFSPESLCLPVVGLVQYLNFLTNLNAILYGHLVIDKHSTDWLEKFQF